MDNNLISFESPLFRNLDHVVDGGSTHEQCIVGPTGIYVSDARAMAAFPADLKEYPNSYVFIVEMPGVKSGDMEVQVDDDVLLIRGERKKVLDEEEKEGVKYVRTERRIGKFIRQFALPENANSDKMSAIFQDGVLTVTVEKLPPPEPKKPKTIQVQVA